MGVMHSGSDSTTTKDSAATGPTTTGPTVTPAAAGVPLVTSRDPASACRSPLGTFAECPMCGGSLFPEHAHFRCSGCGWRDSCCD
jgi:hypothetical protein